MHKWTDEQISYLKEIVNDKDVSYTQAVNMLNNEFGLQLSSGQVMNKIISENIHNSKSRGYQKVKDEYIDFLKENSKNHTCTELANLVNDKFNTNFKVDCIRRVLDNLNIEYKKRNITTRIYTPEQLSFIEDRKNNTYQTIIDEFYNTYGIKLSRGSIGYVFNRYNIKRESGRITWTDVKVNFITENFKNMTNEEMVEAFNKKFDTHITPSQINEKLYREGFKTKKRKGLLKDCIPTSFKMSDKLCKLYKDISKEIGVSHSKFIRDAVKEFLNNDSEISLYISSDLHKTSNAHRKNYLQSVNTSTETYYKMAEYAEKHKCCMCDIYLQSLIDYCNHVSNDVKYLPEDLF